MYSDTLLELSDASDGPDFDDTAFFDAAGMVYNAGGFDVSQLSTPEARRLIAETLAQLNRAIVSGLSYEVPETLRHALENNAFIFSGFKAYHTLREVGLSLTTDTGEIKPFETFRRDVEKVNNQYNHNYLYAEYNHAVGSSLMAERWQQIERDGDRYDLQYRTAQDDRVREDHAILHGTTLPPSDPFWSLYLPPNGWNCRCTAVQVRKGKYPQSDPALSMLRGNNCTEAAKQQIFRFNPGKTLQLFPPKHPYFPKGCGSCDRSLLLAYDPKREQCRACLEIKKAADAHSEQTLAQKVADIINAKGRELTSLLRQIILERRFKPVPGHEGITSAIDKDDPDFKPLLGCAVKAVGHGYNVAILPNPKGVRSPDCILFNAKFIAAYDVKTISGQNSVGNRLMESIGQTNRVILNMATTYNARSLAREIRTYFEANKDAVEVVIFKGGAMIKVSRSQIGPIFEKKFMKRYGRKK